MMCGVFSDMAHVYMKATFLGVAASLCLGCADANNPNDPTTGTIDIVITTIGPIADRDADGYVLSINGGVNEPVTASSVTTIKKGGVAPGTHLVGLAGLAPNCIVDGANPRSVELLAGASSVVVNFSVVCSVRKGVVQISVQTSGADPDLDGYSVILGGVLRRDLPATGIVNVADVPTGRLDVALVGLAANCTVEGVSRLDVDVTFSDTTRVFFAVKCIGSGSIVFTTTMTGVDLDSNGYVVELRRDGIAPTRITVPATGSVTASGLFGAYRLTLLDLTANCDVVSPDSRTVSASADVRASISLEIECAPPTQIAFMGGIGNDLEIYVANSNGTGTKRVTNNPGTDSDPAWSPDGFRIAFASDRSGGNNRDIYVMNADGTNPVRLTTNPAWDYRPTWSPDGSRIAFTSDRNGNAIYVMNADGTNEARVANQIGANTQAAWSPDGGKIAFESNRGGIQAIWTMNADGSNAARIVSGSSPAWSPNGSMIAFVREQSLFVINADGSGLKEVLDYDEYLSDPSWSPDGKKILFGTYSGYDFDAASTLGLLIVGLDGTLYSAPTNMPLVANPAWGRR